MLSRSEFLELLDYASGADKKLRLQLIDQYDHARRSAGMLAADAVFMHQARITHARRTLDTAADKLRDQSAKNRLKRILAGDDSEIIRVAGLLSDEKISRAIYAQIADEEMIRKLAAPYATLENPNGHLKMRRRFRRYAKQAVAQLNLTLGLVGQGAHKHATPYEISLRDQQKGRWKQFGKKTKLVRGDVELSMLDIMREAGRKKMAEVFTLTKGLESYASAAGLTWAFVTLTAPPQMHPNPSQGTNSWDGTLPDAAHQWIHSAWHKAEARIRKQGIVISGLRVVEPHKDGCPHWHVLVFAMPEQMASIEATFRQQPEWKSEQGMKFVLNDGRAKASSYAFKYVLKTISSIENLKGEQASVDAWRSTWGVRAFQFFGMPSVNLWRNMRATKECPAEPLLAGLWRAANRGDGHAFIGLAGGLNCKRSERPVYTKSETTEETKTIRFIIRETGEATEYARKKWEQVREGEPRKPSKHAEVEVILNCPRTPKTTHLPPPLRGVGALAARQRGKAEPHSRPRLAPISPIHPPCRLGAKTL